MFGAKKKLEELQNTHTQELEELREENALLKQKISDLEMTPVKIDDKKDEIIDVLLSSYDNGTSFLHKTVQSPLDILDDINQLNDKSASNMEDLVSETNTIALSIEKIQIVLAIQ